MALTTRTMLDCLRAREEEGFTRELQVQLRSLHLTTQLCAGSMHVVPAAVEAWLAAGLAGAYADGAVEEAREFPAETDGGMAVVLPAGGHLVTLVKAEGQTCAWVAGRAYYARTRFWLGPRVPVLPVFVLACACSRWP